MNDRPWINARYRVEAKLGEGGMGRVFEATDMRLDRRVALKLMPRVDRPDLLERFRHEAMAVARLNHPHIVIIHDYDQADPSDPGLESLVLPVTASPSSETAPRAHPAAVDSDAPQPVPHDAIGVPAIAIDVDPEADTGDATVPQPFIVMEYLPGTNIDRAGLDRVGDVLRVGQQLTDALAYAHQRGVVHRDIKPDNIRVLPSGRAKLLDFGIATFRGRPRMTESGELVGTFAYMSPEQALGLDVDARSDLYSLGLVLYQLLTGVLPFAENNVVASLSQRVALAPVRLRTLRPELPEALDQIVARALAREPGARFPDAGAFGRALSELANRLALPTAPRRAGSADGDVADAHSRAQADTAPPPQSAPGASPPAGGRPQSDHTSNRPLRDRTPSAPNSSLRSAPATSADTEASRVLPELIGREDALRTVETALRNARIGLGAALLVGGVPGIGKTALIDRASEMARSLGFHVRRGRVLDESRVSFEPFLHVVREDLRARRPTLDWLGSDGPVLGAMLHDLDALVTSRQTDVDVPIVVEEPTTVPASPSNRARLASLQRYIARAAAASPLLVVLEDFHDADAPSVALLRRLIDDAPGAQMVILVEHCRRGLQRDEPLHTLLFGADRDTSAERITLSALTRDQSATLITRRLPSASPGFVDAVHFAAGGRPGLALGLLPTVPPAVWPDSPDALPLPEGIRESLTRDLESLAGDAPRVLSNAAVLGPRGFDFDTLLALVGSHDDESDRAEDALIDVLQSAEEAWLLHTSDDQQYRFDCDVVRRVLYERMHPRRRSRAHRRAATLMSERVAPARDVDRALHELELARHLARGDRPALADDALGALARALDAWTEPFERFADRALLRSLLHALRGHIATHAPLIQRAASIYLQDD